MDISSIRNLINKGEGITIEFKSSQEELTQSGFETVVAFLNTIGGYLFLGVADDGTITGVAAGTATITASMTYDGLTYTDTCNVTVTESTGA